MISLAPSQLFRLRQPHARRWSRFIDMGCLNRLSNNDMARTMLISVLLALLSVPASALEISAFKDLTDEPGRQSDEADAQLIERINDLERAHSEEIARLKERIEELEIILRRMQQPTLTRLQKDDQVAFEQRRSENWARVTNGMQRQDVYRLLGRGIKDTKSTLDCRCYIRGRVCFNENDLSIKSELRCEL